MNHDETASGTLATTWSSSSTTSPTPASRDSSWSGVSATSARPRGRRRASRSTRCSTACLRRNAPTGARRRSSDLTDPRRGRVPRASDAAPRPAGPSTSRRHARRRSRRRRRCCASGSRSHSPRSSSRSASRSGRAGAAVAAAPAVRSTCRCGPRSPASYPAAVRPKLGGLMGETPRYALRRARLGMGGKWCDLHLRHRAPEDVLRRSSPRVHARRAARHRRRGRRRRALACCSVLEDHGASCSPPTRRSGTGQGLSRLLGSRRRA